MSKLKIIIPVVVLLGAVVIYWFMLRSNKTDVEGHWKLTTGDTGCYTGVVFLENPLSSSGGVSTEETNGNHVQMSYGTYTHDKDDSITVHLSNPESPPFPIHVDRSDSTLTLEYDMDGKQATCSYNLTEDSN